MLETDMIHAEAMPIMPPKTWEALVETCGGNPLHLPFAHEVDLSEKDRLHLVFQNDTNVVACAIAYRQKAGWRKKDLYLPAPPAFVSPDMREAVMQSLLDFARRSGFREIHVAPHWGVTFDALPSLSGHAEGVIIEFALDLSPDLETLLAGMHKVHRKNIRRAERNEIAVRQDRSLEALLSLRAMQEVAAERSAERGGGFKVRDRAYFERVQERVYAPGFGELLLAEQHGTPVAALAYLTGARRAITVRSGATPIGYETYAMYLLQYEVIKRAKERGSIELNLGGVTEAAAEEGHPERGLYDFKRGFGGNALRSTGLRVVVNP